MKAIPTREQNPDGLHQRYRISKRSGEDIHPKAEYFILRLDDHGKDPKHIEACKIAVLSYAEAIKPHIPKLADDLIQRYADISTLKLPYLSPTALMGLGSAVVHFTESAEDGGTPLDLSAAYTSLKDPELKKWMEDMTELSLLPLKRKS